MEGIAIFSAAATVMCTFVVGRIGARMDRRIKQQQEDDTERRNAYQKGEYEHQARFEAMCMGVQAMLRTSIIQDYNHYKDKGKLPVYAMENVTKLYKAYHGLGGNGTITKLYDELMKLPHEG